MDKLRNVAIIAHVDHGKTTLVDELLKQSGVYRENQEIVDRVMDSNDLERERGITIMAKNTAVWYGDTKINIVDTPGHADFGGEVERILKMVNGVILLVDAAEPLPFVKIGAPTLEMTFSVNDSPFAGREGKFVTSRQIRDRLMRETLKDVSLRVTDVPDSTDSFNVAGRGEMSLSILIETMRREGYEFQVSPPRVLYQEIDGKRCEPVERVVVDVPSEYMGAVMEKLGARKGEFIEMTPVGSRTKLEFLVPSRGLFGYRNEFLTDTKGEGILASVFERYEPYKGDISRRATGSLIAWETGEAVAYGIWNAQDRGAMFITPGTKVYGGMVVGVCPKSDDVPVNVCRTKHLTNTRASGSDEALRLVPPKQLSLEQCLEFLADDELLEVTPKSLRLRKRILDHSMRMKNVMKNR